MILTELKKKRGRITVLILENRQMIASTLADLIQDSGYSTCLVSDIDAAQELLPKHLPAFLLVDLGVIPPESRPQWESLEKLASTLSVPVLPFYCSPLPESENVMVLRSPSDFGTVVDRIEDELHKKQPYLGMTLVEMGLLSLEDLGTALHVQHDLAQTGRPFPLGELLVRLGMVGQEDVERALRKQER